MKEKQIAWDEIVNFVEEHPSGYLSQDGRNDLYNRVSAFATAYYKELVGEDINQPSVKK